MENEIIDTVPKSLKQKERRLLDKIKGTVSWNDCGEIVYKNAPVPGSNFVDLVNDALRKRKLDSHTDDNSFREAMVDVLHLRRRRRAYLVSPPLCNTRVLNSRALQQGVIASWLVA